MRTRNRTIVNRTHASAPYTTSFVITSCGSGPGSPIPYDVPAISLDTDYVSEHMEDMVGSKSVPHPVLHRKKSYRLEDLTTQPLVLPRTDGDGGRVTYSNVGPLWWTSNRTWLDQNDGFLPEVPGLPNGWTIDMSDINETSLRNEAAQRAKQLLADVLLNVVEANQMWPSIKSLASLIPTFRRQEGTFERAFRNPRQAVLKLAGGYLAYKFGIKPIISDATAIWKGFGRLRNDIKRHVDGEKFRGSARSLATCNYTKAPLTYGPAFGVTWLEVHYSGVAVEQPTIRYVFVVKPKVQFQASLLRKLDAVISRFSTSPAALAWELVPFSFVIDWFVDIRGALDLLDKTLGVSPWELVSATRSYSYKLLNSTRHILRETCAGGVLSAASAGSIECSHYERSLVSGANNLVTWKPRFGKNQAGITAALVAQALSKKR